MRYDIIFHIEERSDGFYRATCYEKQQYTLSEWYLSPWAAIEEIVSEWSTEDELEHWLQAEQKKLKQWQHACQERNET